MLRSKMTNNGQKTQNGMEVAIQSNQVNKTCFILKKEVYLQW